MGGCGGGCMMRWRSGRRFREVLFRDCCVSVVSNHQAWKIGIKVLSLVFVD
jgi:hypothetical protein